MIGSATQKKFWDELNTMEQPTQRSAEQVREHYEIEKELAAKLRSSPKTERRSLYTALYDELFRRVPHHPQLTRKTSSDEQRQVLDDQMSLLERCLDQDTTFLEIGPGDCALSFEVARRVKSVYAVDVSETITDSSDAPGNFTLYISDGSSIPVPEASVDVAYSNQLMEHLHEDDALDQLRNIFTALVPGGMYVCITPNRLDGPHDISRGFDSEATGFHLKEYTVTELRRLFREVGFSKVKMFIGARGHFVKTSVHLTTMCEWLLGQLPVKWQRKMFQSRIIGQLIAIRLVGVK